ncbi:hypothetical protein EV182_000316 [Spiromyces aspiralis]|uniref:Uncharacterized protein n=1 Tax=Spiromyces aspiralis TaxID=68401 RepID=A0ACC1HH88_9FUNG|nr:hypothetical protein EV182_000316 [Spiromyces aspiralis]
MEINSLFNVSGKIAVVTGGGRGIGYMIAEGFVRNGARVYIVSRSKEACANAASKLTSIGPGECISIPADLQDYEQIKALVKELERREPEGINILVNNSGANWAAPLSEYPDKGFSKVINLNLQRVFTMTQMCLELLKKKGTHEDPARVINIGSIDGIHIPPSETYAYSASKAGLHQLTRVLAGNLGRENISVNAVAPGPFESKMMRETLTKYHDAVVSHTPLGRIGKPRDMAGICLFLASPAGSYISGAVIPVDGGILIANHPYSAKSKL